MSNEIWSEGDMVVAEFDAEWYLHTPPKQRTVQLLHAVLASDGIIKRMIDHESTC